ncbi:Two-component response regulator SSK1p, partial [Coemansia helicoidea]
MPASDRPEASVESGLSRTRARIRDKMAQLSRVRHRARNRLLGISEGSEAASAAEGSEPCNAAEGAERGASLESALRTSLGEAGAQLVTRARSNTAGPPAALSHREREMDVDKALPDPPAAPESAASAQAPQEKDAAHPPRKAAGAADRKERLRARLQNASRRLAESQAAGGPPPEQKRQLAERPRGGVGSKSPPATDAAQPHSAAAAAGGTASGGGSRRSSAKEKQSARRVVRDSQGNSTPPIRVLLVEDNLVNRSVMERFLTHMNVHYDVASNGEEAIRKWTAAADESRTPGGERTAAHGPYHIVFMDIQMPLMDGITATKHIRRLERQKHIGLWVPTGSVASMHAGHLSPKPQPQPQQGTRVPMP